MRWRTRLYSGLNVLGWCVVMPVLVAALLSPFVNFSGWPGGSAQAQEQTVALMPPRLTEHGSLPPLTEAPRPESRVPQHRMIVPGFEPAPPAAGPRAATRPSRRSAGTGRRRAPAAPPRRPGTRGPRAPVRAVGGGDPTPVRTPVPASPAPAPVAPRPPAGKPAAPPKQPGNGNGNGPQSSPPGQGSTPPGNPDKPQKQPPGQANRPQDQPPGQGNGNGNGNGDGGKPDHAQQGGQNRGAEQRGNGRG